MLGPSLCCSSLRLFEMEWSDAHQLQVAHSIRLCWTKDATIACMRIATNCSVVVVCKGQRQCAVCGDDGRYSPSCSQVPSTCNSDSSTIDSQRFSAGAGRLAMLAFVGFVMAAQVTGLGPLAALGQHLSDPISAPPHACFAACRSIAAVLFLYVFFQSRHFHAPLEGAQVPREEELCSYHFAKVILCRCLAMFAGYCMALMTHSCDSAGARTCPSIPTDEQNTGKV